MSARRTLQTLQMSANIDKVWTNTPVGNDEIAKENKASTPKSALKTPSKGTKSDSQLNSCKENVGSAEPKSAVRFSTPKGRLQLSNPKTVSPSKSPKLDRSPEEADEENDSTDVVSWMTAENPPEEYWKVLAEQRRIALEESLQENEELYETVDLLTDKIESQNATIEAQNKTILDQKEEIDSKAAEIVTLREVVAEVDRLTNIFEELTGGP